jgi:hypothetical protein
VNRFGEFSLGALAAGVAGAGYAMGVERRWWTLREATLPVLAPGSRPLRLLHVSDLHMTPGQRSKQRWVARLAELEPDLVVNTGDNLAHPRAVPSVLAALGPLLDRPGLFVFGSNDYYGPTPKNPARYLRRETRLQFGEKLPWRDLRAAMRERGWHDATHTSNRTVTTGSPDPPTRPRRCAWAWRTPPSPGSWTPSPPTATTSCWRVTHTAVSSGSPATVRSSRTAASTAPGPAARRAGAPGCGCTSPPVWARHRGRRCVSPARPRRAC